MTIARYSFLPWLRRGIANQLQAPASSASRASLSVSLTVSSDVESQPLTPKTVELVGPGDVIGFNPQLVVRTEPRNWIADFEPNYLAFVEFYDEDFPWRYTPASPDTAAHRLPPWITLLLLKETEFTRDNSPGKPLPSISLTPAANAAALFAPAEQLWAWAHVHVNDALGPGHAPDLDGLDARLRANPDVGYSRLICPRRLEPNTGYTAVVIPTFEVGRKAGLAEAVADTDSGLAISWAAATEFPVYYEWYFRTGAAGDFEELVRALKPRAMPKEVGIRDMDIQQPGFGMPPIRERAGRQRRTGGRASLPLHGLEAARSREQLPAGDRIAGQPRLRRAFGRRRARRTRSSRRLSTEGGTPWWTGSARIRLRATGSTS